MKRKNSLLYSKEGFESVYEDESLPDEKLSGVSTEIILRDILLEALRQV